MNNKVLLVGLALAVVAGIGVWQAGGVDTTPGVSLTSESPSSPNAVEPTKSNTNPASSGNNVSGQNPKVYTSAAYNFSFEYPAGATLETVGLSSGGLQGESAVGIAAAYVRFDNVVDRLAVNVSAFPSDVGSCMNKPHPQTSTATISGVPFLTYKIEEEVQGQMVVTTVYRVVRNSVCYEIRDVVNSPVIAQLTAAEVAQRTANIEAAKAFSSSILNSFTFTD